MALMDVDDTEVIPNSLPKSVCEMKANILAMKHKLRSKHDELVQKKEDILNAFLAILWGIPDAIAASILKALTQIARQVLKMALEQVSAIIASALESVFMLFMYIILEVKSSIFAIVTIPRDVAIKHLDAEMDSLNSLDTDISKIKSIVGKWSKKMNPEDYGSNITSAMPSIEAALDAIVEIIAEVEDDIPYFDKSKYNTVLVNINSAISTLTINSPMIGGIELPTAGYDSAVSDAFEERKAKVKAEYNEKREEAKIRYQEREYTIENKTDKEYIYYKPRPQTPYEQENTFMTMSSLDKYKYDIRIIDMEEKTILNAQYYRAIADVDIHKYTAGAVNKLKDEFGGFVSGFADDMAELYKALGRLGKNISAASMHYRAYQMYVNTMYNWKEKIENLVEDIVGFLTKGASASSSFVASKSMRRAAKYIALADKYGKDYVKDIEDGKNIAQTSEVLIQTKMSTMLDTSDLVLASSITDSIIKSVNSTKEFLDETKQFDDMMHNIEMIPDWNGATGVWAVDPYKSSQSPHSKFMAWGTAAGIQAPLASVSTGSHQNPQVEKLNILLNNMSTSVSLMKSHNSSVRSAIMSFDPPTSDHVEKIKQILSSMNLLEVFAGTMMFSSLVESVVADVKKIKGGDFKYKRCEEKYPDLFSNSDVKEEMALTKIRRRDRDARRLARDINKFKIKSDESTNWSGDPYEGPYSDNESRFV